MRTRNEIIKDRKSYEALTLEVLLDIRELLLKERKTKRQYRRKKKEIKNDNPS